MSRGLGSMQRHLLANLSDGGMRSIPTHDRSQYESMRRAMKKLVKLGLVKECWWYRRELGKAPRYCMTGYFDDLQARALAVFARHGVSVGEVLPAGGERHRLDDPALSVGEGNNANT